MFLLPYQTDIPEAMRKWVVLSVYVIGGLANAVYALVTGDVIAQTAAVLILLAGIFVGHIDYSDEA